MVRFFHFYFVDLEIVCIFAITKITNIMTTGKKLLKANKLAVTTQWHWCNPCERHCDTDRNKGARKIANRTLRRRLKEEMRSEVNECF